MARPYSRVAATPGKPATLAGHGRRNTGSRHGNPALDAAVLTKDEPA